jgi:phosphinothricin acetyltransferase
MIRPVSHADAAAICDIYNYYIENTAVSFEEKPLRFDEMEERIRKISAKYPYLVWEEEGAVPGDTNPGGINGYAYINTWRERSAYRFAAEVSIYLRDGFQGRGMGKELMARLLDEARKTDIHALVAGITLPNERSVALHEKFGFRKTARFAEVGYKFNKWLDVGYWELLIKKERP